MIYDQRKCEENPTFQILLLWIQIRREEDSQRRNIRAFLEKQNYLGRRQRYLEQAVPEGKEKILCAQEDKIHPQERSCPSDGSVSKRDQDKPGLQSSQRAWWNTRVWYWGKWKIMKLFIWYFLCQNGKPYKRTSALSRKASNCRSDSSLDSSQNNSSVHKKKSKKGFVKNLHNNNISQNDDKSCLQKIRDFYEKRSSYSFFYFAEDSG